MDSKDTRSVLFAEFCVINATQRRAASKIKVVLCSHCKPNLQNRSLYPRKSVVGCVCLHLPPELERVEEGARHQVRSSSVQRMISCWEHQLQGAGLGTEGRGWFEGARKGVGVGRFGWGQSLIGLVRRNSREILVGICHCLLR